ncbi:MAG TPA: TonB-dependent receptor [Pyrinomonadaceae bacterium]|nr:TonB-dependent receptor [Pyrinomonadaceae bacterium]
MRKLLLFTLVVFMCGLFLSVPTFAQTINGSITGQVTDANGAAVAGATVTVKNLENGLNRDVVTDDEGLYRIGSLPGGPYEVKVEKSGFGSAIENTRISTGADTAVNFKLSAGPVTAEVQVSDTGALLETTQSQVIKTVDQQKIMELPGRNSLNGLALLNPGVLPNQNGRPGSGFAVNGNRTRSNNFTIDGANNNDQSLSIPRQNLPPEAIGEFQIITNTFAAEFGRNAGSYVNQITRSGTNEFHGTGFYVWQGNGVDSLTTNQQRCFNSNRAAPANAALSDERVLRQCRNVTVDTIWGGTLGGPIKKNHTFFFTSYDANPFRTTLGSVTRAALDATSRARLLAFRNNFASPAAVDFALNNFPVANDPTPAAGTVAASQVILRNAAGVPIAGAGQEAASTVTFLTFNRFSGAGVPYQTNFWRYLGKINTKINDKDQLSFRFLYDKATDNGQPASLPGLELGQIVTDDSFTINDVYLITPNLINEARFTYSRRKISFPENYEDFANGAQLAVAGANGAFSGGNANFPQSRDDHVLEITENIGYTTGNHALKFGYNLLRYDLNSIFAPNSRGNISYSSLNNFFNDISNGVQNAAGNFQTRPITYEHSFFAQDDWRVNPDLTVNLGMRYEYVTTPFGYFSNTKPDKNNFGPRAGFAWNPKDRFNGNFVFRAGYGVSYDQVFQNILLNVSRNYPRVVTNSLANCTGCAAFSGFGAIPLTATTTTNLATQGVATVRAFFARTPENFPAALAQVLDYRYYGLNDRAKSPMSQQWTVSFQYQLGRDYVAKAEYIGTKGSNLVREIETNYGFSAPLGNGQRIDPTRGSIINGQGLANSIYHSMQLTLDRRFSSMEMFGINWGSTTFNANYTWSSFISESDDVLGGQTNRTIPSDPRDPHSDRGRSGFDQPHRFVMNAVWISPEVYKGNSIMNRLASGWEISGVATMASGIPFTIYNANNAAGITASQITTVFLSQHVGLNPSGTPGTFTTTNAAGVPVDPSARYLIYPANSGIFGSLGANTERTPSTYNLNASLVKNIKTFGESQRLQLRMEVFNVFNHRNFTTIPTNTLSATTNPANFLNFGLTNATGRSFTFGARYFF